MKTYIRELVEKSFKKSDNQLRLLRLWAEKSRNDVARASDGHGGCYCSARAAADPLYWISGLEACLRKMLYHNMS